MTGAVALLPRSATADQMADVLGVGVRSVRTRLASGELPKVEGGGTDLVLLIRLGAEAYGAGKRSERGVSPLDAAKIAMYEAQHDRIRTQTRMMSADLVEADEVLKIGHAVLDPIRSGFLGLPNRAAPVLFGLQSAQAISDELTRLVHGILGSISAAEFAGSVREIARRRTRGIETDRDFTEGDEATA